LLIYFTNNSPKEINNYPIEQKGKKIKLIVDNILAEIKFPKPKIILDKLFLKYYFYDVTFQDFHNENFLGELLKKNVINKKDLNKIVEFKKVFDIT